LSFGGRETVELPPVAGVSSVRRFSGAAGTGGATPTNSVAQFAVDFAPAGSLFQGLRAIIISADPFFQENKEQLIQAVNNWLAPENSGAGFFGCELGPRRHLNRKDSAKPRLPNFCEGQRAPM
jgi:hypothetical protein